MTAHAPAAGKIPTLVSTCFAIDIVLCAAYVLNWLVGQPFVKPTSLLDLNGENSIPAWYSSVQFFTIFLFAAVYVRKRFAADVKAATLLVLPALFLMMSLDETVMIHEWLGEKSDAIFPSGTRKGTAFQETGIWMFAVGAPFVLFFSLWVRSVRKHIADRRNLNKLVTGLGVMLSGALGCEFVSNFVHGMWSTVELVCEEGLEMIGATVMLWAVHDLAQVTIIPVAEAEPICLRKATSSVSVPGRVPSSAALILPAVVEQPLTPGTQPSDSVGENPGPP